MFGQKENRSINKERRKKRAKRESNFDEFLVIEKWKSYSSIYSCRLFHHERTMVTKSGWVTTNYFVITNNPSSNVIKQRAFV